MPDDLEGEVKKPWETRAKENIKRFESHTTISRYLFRQHAKLEHHAMEASDSVYKDMTVGGLARHLLRPGGWREPTRDDAKVIAYRLFNEAVMAGVFQGQFIDPIAEQFETLTKVPKKRAQDWNAILSTLEHIPFVLGGYGATEAVAHAGEQSLYVTLSIAAASTVWNAYRLLNRDEKARPAIGYGSLAMHSSHILNKMSDTVTPIIRKAPVIKQVADTFDHLGDTYKRRARMEGHGSIIHAAGKDIVYNMRNAAKELGYKAAGLTGLAAGSRNYWKSIGDKLIK
ncbi:MAG: hypothetical protein ACLFO2_02395 [Candidatus Woesearchaeota archaeon]